MIILSALSQCCIHDHSYLIMIIRCEALTSGRVTIFFLLFIGFLQDLNISGLGSQDLLK